MSGADSTHSLSFCWQCQLSLRKQARDIFFCFSKSKWIPLCTMLCVSKSSLSHFISYLRPSRQVMRQYRKMGYCLFTVIFILGFVRTLLLLRTRDWEMRYRNPCIMSYFTDLKFCSITYLGAPQFQKLLGDRLSWITFMIFYSPSCK